MSKKKVILLIAISLVLGIVIGVGVTLGLSHNKNTGTFQPGPIMVGTTEDGDSGTLSAANPVSGMSREEAEKTAEQLGEGIDMGTWKTMSGDEFMEWWRSANNVTDADIDDD